MQMVQLQYTEPKNFAKSDEELIHDLQAVAKKLNANKVSMPMYTKHGRYDCSTFVRRFGSWNNAIAKAGLKISNIVNYSDEALFENILNVWQYKGSQPTRRDMNIPTSTISSSAYNRRFVTWRIAILEFINYANSNDYTINDGLNIQVTKSNSTTSRDPSLRLRYKVLKRDNFSCVQCGGSPAKNQAVELHIDHITPWSKGGVTEINNLQTLCQNCNLGKGNLI